MGTIAPGGLVATHAPVPPGSQGNALQARADTAYSTEWDVQEQATLDAALARYPADRHPPLERYVRAAASLPKKNVRDVALRVAWMRATAAARKRKAVDEANSKKQVRRERGQSIFAVQPKAMGASVGPHPMGQHSMGMGMGVAPTANMGMVPSMATPGSSIMQPPGMAFAQPIVPMAPPLMSQLDDHGAGTVGVVGGPLSQLLEQNYAILNQFKQNMEVYKVNENTELLVRFRDNILTVLNQMNAMQGVMQQMPPLPVRLNVELANNFLPKAVANGVCQVPYMAAPMHGMPAVPGMGQQGSAAMPQASMPSNAVSAAALGFTAPLVTPQPGVNGISAAAPVLAAPAALPTSAPAAVPTTLPTSMPGMGAAQQPGVPAPGAPPVQVAAVKQEPAAEAQPGQAPVPIKAEPGVTAPGSMPMPAGPAASAALFRPPPPLNTMYYPPSSAPVGLAAHVAAAPVTSMPPSSAAPAVQLPTAQQQQQQQQRPPAISAGMADPTKVHLDALFPSSSGAQPAAVQDPSTSAGGLYDVLASITANTPGMLQPAMQQPFSAPQPALAPAPAVAPAVMPASQPQASAAPAMSMQPGGVHAVSAAAAAPVPYPVVQTGQQQVAMLQQQHGPGRPQATVQGGTVPTPLPHSQAMPASTPAPSMAPVQAQAAVQNAPVSQHGPKAASAAAAQQQQPPAAAQASSAAAPAIQTAAPAVPAAPQSAAQPQQPPVQPANAPPVEARKAQPQAASSQAQPPPKAAPKQAPTSAASANPAAAPASAGLGKAAGAAPAAHAVLPQQQQAPQQPAGTPASAAAAAAAASASSQKAGPAVATRSSSVLSPGRPQRATRSMAAKR